MAKSDPQSIKAVAARIAKAKDIEADEAAKLLRSRIRANFDLVTAHWPALKAQGKVNKDGNRYPAMPPTLADALVTAVAKGTPVKEALAKPRKARKPKATVTPTPEAPTS